MKTIRKNIFWLFVVLVMALLQGACSDDSGNSGDSNGYFPVDYGEPTWVAMPEASISGRPYYLPFTSEQSITLSCATPGATIYYTLDGTDPDKTSTEYSDSDPFILDTIGDYLIKAFAVKDGMKDSTIMEESYTLRAALTVTVTGTNQSNPPITTALNFSFSMPVSGFSGTDINIIQASYTPYGAVTRGILSGSGRNWTLPVTTTVDGYIYVSINHDEIGMQYNSNIQVYRRFPYWTQIPGVFPGATAPVINSIARGGYGGVGNFVAVSSDGRIAYSPANDGRTWTLAASPFPAGTPIHKTIEAFDSYYAMTSNYQIARSSNGITWTLGNMGLPNDRLVNDIAMQGNPYNNIVAVCSNGKMYRSNLTTPPAFSEITHSSLGLRFSANQINTIVGGDSTINYRLVAGGTQGTFGYSNDSDSWIATNSPALFGNSDFLKIIWANNMFVAVGADGKTGKSSDGINWTSIPAIAALGRINGIVGGGPADAGGGRFVIVGETGRIAYSSDTNLNSSWNEIPVSYHPFNGTIPIRGIAAGQWVYVAVGANGMMAYSRYP